MLKRFICPLLLVIGLCKFPSNFEFGASTSAFQIEGAWLDEGKSMSHWDNLAHTSGVVADDTNADIADNSYNLYTEDIAIMKEYGIKNYRMSISWPRIVPYGVNGSAVNEKAIAHYRKQFQDMISAGITPYVTLYHGDMPSFLFIKGKGFVDPDFVTDFTYYADICFKRFGDLVKYWFTFNEPFCISVFDEYEPEELNTKPYQVGRALLLAHAQAVKVYRDKYQATQKGKIGWVVNAEMYFPKDPKDELHKKAAERGLAFQLDWFMQPLFTGQYPELMVQTVGSRLKPFTPEESKLLKGSLDFFALNHYFTFLAEPKKSGKRGFYDDMNITTTIDETRKRTDMDWPVVPEGFYELIMYVHKKWLKDSGLELYITENGAAVKEPDAASALNDQFRIDYLFSYLSALDKAIQDGAKVTKYFVWSLLDNFEWGGGLAKRFGLVRVEYGKDVKRIPKGSLKWYSNLIKSFS